MAVLVNLCTNGEVIASNAYQPTHITRTKENAFDGDMSTLWASMSYPSDIGWIGYDFKRTVNIKQIIINQIDGGNNIPLIMIQSSNNGIDWIDIGNYNINPTETIINIDNDDYYYQYRILAKSNTVGEGWGWAVSDIKMLGLYKFLIKQYGQYYSINQSNYDTSNKAYIPLTLSGGIIPNLTDLDTYGFDNIKDLTESNTINGETFKPIGKLDDSFEVVLYKPN